MNIKDKYKGKSIPWLLKKCQYYFNLYIRLRDEGKPCISCGKPHFEHASHFFPVKGNQQMRFDEDNCHGGCAYCNTFLYGNQFEYSKRLPKRIGKERFNALLKRQEEAKRNTGFKWQRWELIEKIEYYKERVDKKLKQ